MRVDLILGQRGAAVTQKLNGPRQIHRIPENDSCERKVEAAGAVLLIFIAAVAELASRWKQTARLTNNI